MFSRHPYHIKQFLDFSREWTCTDVEYLDDLIRSLHSRTLEKKKEAFLILSKFMEGDDAWTRIDRILISHYPETKIFGLEILKNLIKAKWKSFSASQRLGLKKYILTHIWVITSTDKLSENEEKILNMFNLNLLQILEYEYPKDWPEFIRDIFSATKGRSSIAFLNTLRILALMSDMILNIPAKQISWTKAKQIRLSKSYLVKQIFHLCNFALHEFRDSKLLHCVSETMLQFILWIPSDIIFETNFTKMLIHRFAASPNQCVYQCFTLQLLIVIVHMCDKKHNNKLLSLFSQFVEFQKKLCEEQFTSKGPSGEIFVPFQKMHCYSITFLSTILKKDEELVEKLSPRLFDIVFSNLLSLSSREDTKVVKLCMECLKPLINRLCNERMQRGSYDHSDLTSKLCKYIISEIKKPEDIIFKKDNRKTKKSNQDEDSVQIYTYMMEILALLAFLDCDVTMKIIGEKIFEELNNNPELSTKKLKSPCYAAVSIKDKSVQVKGSLYRCIPKAVEERFFWGTLYQVFLHLREVKKGTTSEQIVQLNFLYVIGEYAEYINLRGRPLLNLLLGMLFKLMQDKQSDVQGIACKSFLCIVRNCKEAFVEVQPEEEILHYLLILNSMDEITKNLENENMVYFYEALGHIVATGASNTNENLIKERIQVLMAPQNLIFEFMLHQSVDAFGYMKPTFIDDAVWWLRINVGACKGMGYDYIHQFLFIFKDKDLFILYEHMSRQLCKFMTNGMFVLKQSTIKALQKLRKEVLTLISTWVSFVKTENQRTKFKEECLQLLNEHILNDYCECPLATAHESEVLTLLSIIVINFQDSARYEVEVFFSFIFEKTTKMMAESFEAFPEISISFFKFIFSVIAYCFNAIIDMFLSHPHNLHFENIMGLIIRAIKQDTMKDITNLGFASLLRLLRKFQIQSFHGRFCERYFYHILENVFSVILDTSHTTAETYKACILSHMLKLIANEDMQYAIHYYDHSGRVPKSLYIQYYVAHLVHMKNRDLTIKQSQVLVELIFKHYQNIPILKRYLKDLPILIEEICEINKAQQTSRERSTPGNLKTANEHIS